MEVTAHEPYLDPDEPAWEQVAPVSLEDLITGSDLISIHVPLSDETRNLIGRVTIAAMRRGTNLILTPHIAGITVESNARVGMVTAEHVRTALRREEYR